MVLITRDHAIRAAYAAAAHVRRHGFSWWTLGEANACATRLADYIDSAPWVMAEEVYNVARPGAPTPWSKLRGDERVAYEVFRATYLVLSRLAAADAAEAAPTGNADAAAGEGPGEAGPEP